MIELWKPLIHDEIQNGFELSSLGRIRSAVDKTIEPYEAEYHSTNGYDYSLFLLKFDPLHLTKLEHRLFPIDELLAQTFIPIPDELIGKMLTVKHIDGNNRNNRIDNLEWVEDVEEWKIVVYQDIALNKYIVSNFGNIAFNDSTYTKPALFIDTYGYIRFNAKRTTAKSIGVGVHRLVGTMFLPIISSTDIQVNHIDGVKTNNYWKNLEWVSPKDNTVHAHKTGLTSDGINHYNAILSEEIVHRICELLIDCKTCGNVSTVLNIVQQETDQPVTYDIVCSIKFKGSWKSISDKYFDRDFFTERLREIIKMIYDAALVNYGNTRNTYRYLFDQGFISKYNLSKTFVMCILNKTSYADISNEFFTYDDISYLRFSKIELICNTLIDTDFSIKETYDLLKSKIPYLTTDYIHDIKRKHMFPKIVSQFF